MVPRELRGRLRLSSNLARSASLPTRPSPAAVLQFCSLGSPELTPAERKVCSLTSLPIMDCEVMKGRLEVMASVEISGQPGASPLLWRMSCGVRFSWGRGW